MEQKKCAIDVKKISLAGNLGRHNNREFLKEDAKPFIDESRSHLNYDLIACENYSKTLNEKIKNAGIVRKIRKDAVKSASICVNAPTKDDHDLNKEFFKDTLNFLSNLVGKENVIAATVHNDERTPHMHFIFTPIIKKPNKKGVLVNCLSFKDLLGTKPLLFKLHTDFAKEVGAKYGMRRGDYNSKKKHISSREYRANVERVEQLNVLEKITANFENEKKILNDENKKIKIELENLKKENLALKTEIANKNKELESKVKAINSFINENNAILEKIDKITRETDNELQGWSGLFKTIKRVATNDSELVRMVSAVRLSGDLNEVENKMLKKEIENLKNTIADYRKEIENLKSGNIKLLESEKAENEIRELKKENENLKEFIAKMPNIKNIENLTTMQFYDLQVLAKKQKELGKSAQSQAPQRIAPPAQKIAPTVENEPKRQVGRGRR